MKNKNQDIADSVTKEIAQYHANVAVIKLIIVVSFWSIFFLIFGFLIDHPLNVPREQPNQQKTID
ncbi:MAG: hypothetical protein KME09_00240 [Pleurocapsa minor HA4230-MV1]|jgi:O-antigen/teichoic acid export membrane protein|nr:hypothetical protein [Pleurocapsa minor HA4230-MV1]